MAQWTKRTEAQKSRAKRYRSRSREGVNPLNPAEQAWFDRYEAGLDLELDVPGKEPKESEPESDQDVPDDPGDAGRSPVEPPPASPSVAPVAQIPATDAVPLASPPPPPPPPKAALPRPPKAPPLPPPPRSIEIGHTRGEGDWQSKYGGADSGGREMTCKTIADQIFTILYHMQNQCKDVGVQPVIDLEKVAPCFVLAVDKLLPPEFTITPEIIVAAATATTITQRFMHRTKIAAAQKALAEGNDPAVRKAKAEAQRVSAENQRKLEEAKAYKAKQEADAKIEPVKTTPIPHEPSPPPPPPRQENHNPRIVGNADEDRLA